MTTENTTAATTPPGRHPALLDLLEPEERLETDDMTNFDCLDAPGNAHNLIQHFRTGPPPS